MKLVLNISTLSSASSSSSPTVSPVLVGLRLVSPNNSNRRKTSGADSSSQPSAQPLRTTRLSSTNSRPRRPTVCLIGPASGVQAGISSVSDSNTISWPVPIPISSRRRRFIMHWTSYSAVTPAAIRLPSPLALVPVLPPLPTV